MKFGASTTASGIDPIKKIAKLFRSLVERKPGWYKAVIYYELDAGGKVKRIDEVKVRHFGDDVAVDLPLTFIADLETILKHDQHP